MGATSSMLQSFSALPMDWLALAAVAIICTADSAWAGANRSVAFAIALPLSTVLYTQIFQAALLKGALGPLSSPMMLTGVFVILLFISWIFVFRSLSVFDLPAPLLLSVLCGVAVAICSIVFILSVSSIGDLWHFSPSIEAVFGEAYRFWWLLAAYLAIAFVRT